MSNKTNFFESKVSQYTKASVSNSLEGKKDFEFTDDF